MIEHDMIDGPCACGAWHTPDDPPRPLAYKPTPRRVAFSVYLDRLKMTGIADRVTWYRTIRLWPNFGVIFIKGTKR